MKMAVSSCVQRNLLRFPLFVASIALSYALAFAQGIQAGYQYTDLVSFGDDTLGERPTGPVTIDRQGNILGTTPHGDYHKAFDGTLYQYNPRTRSCTVLLAFGDTVTRGIRPEVEVFLGSDGSLYGTTVTGGTGKQHFNLDDGSGTLYSYNPTTRKYVTLVNFGTLKAPGYGLPRGVIRGKDGCLYGTTIYGGKGEKDNSGYGGTLFSYNPATRLYATLVHFDTPEVPGEQPDGELIWASDGKIYGTTTLRGGEGNQGTLYQYDPVTRQCRTLIRFGAPGVLGREPHGNLFQGKDGCLYGTTLRGGSGKNTGTYINGVGTLYRYNPSTNVYETLVEFGTNGFPGYAPLAGVTMGSDGCLYGTTQFGGTGKKEIVYPNGDNAGGTPYRFNPVTRAYTTIVNFGSTGALGYEPQSGLTLGKDNCLYGTTKHGGKKVGTFSRSAGTLFRLKLPDR